MQDKDKTISADFIYQSNSEGDMDLGTALSIKKEKEYQKLINLMKCFEYMTDFKQKSNFYKQTAMQFRELLNYKDSKLYVDLCMQLAKKSKKDYKKSTYDEAMLMKSKAYSANDYKAASDLFRKIPGYKDADALAMECDATGSTIMNKKLKKLWTRNIVIVLFVIALIFLPRTAHARYYMANTYMHVGSYPSAIERYKKLGAYKDSEERLKESHYLNATKEVENMNYKAAAKEYAAIGNYKDSERQLVLAQQNLIKSSKLGGKIKIGKYDWIILEVADDKAFLMKNTSINEMPFASEAIETTWENSALREWLNSDFYDNSFSDAEKANVALTEVKNSDNVIYNTSGGNDTSDFIFIFSIQEAKDYSYLFPDFKTNTWLRSPGAYPNTAAFLSENGMVMEYGYIVTSNDFKIRPVMWYNLD